MRILLANDDGIYSHGLAAMARVLGRMGEVCIVAPATEQSGVGPGITFLTPLTVKKVYRHGSLWGYAVEGTPVDCVKIGIDKLMGGRPDIVVSGINNGLNVGINVLYSGTVAAAQEASWQGITSFAISTQFVTANQGDKVEKAAELAGELVSGLLERNSRPGALFNINIPFSALEPGADLVPDIVPVDMTPHWMNYEERHDPMNRRYFWVADRPSMKGAGGSETVSDMKSVASGKIAITPLSVNLTHFPMVEEMAAWQFKPRDGYKVPENMESGAPDIECSRWIERIPDAGESPR